MKVIRFAVLAVAVVLLCCSPRPAQPAPTDGPDRDKARTLYGQGNWKDAYEIYARLAVTPDADPTKVDDDLAQAVACLSQLGRQSEHDALIEKAVVVHKGNWRVLSRAASLYCDALDHNGFIVSGAFRRGDHRGGGEYANAMERDRVRALQLQVQAIGVLRDASDTERADEYLKLAHIVRTWRDDYRSWRLQYLTDLTEMPDYDKGYYYWRSDNEAQGAPTDAEGNPIYYHVPRGWNEAANDGERWRWALAEAERQNPKLHHHVTWTLADFLYQQFDVHTLGGYGWFYSREADPKNPGTYALHTLKENETLARLASGVKRFTLPEEFNYIAIFQQLAKDPSFSTAANMRLGELFENRRQYPRAVEYWQQVKSESTALHHLKQIQGNWGEFEGVGTQPAGTGATVEFRFRNATKVRFTAQAIDVAALLADSRAYLRDHPKQIESGQMDIENIGYRLVYKNQTKYLGKQVADWSLKLTPREAHFDRRITVATPLKTAGAYLLTAKVDNGNVSRVIIWVADLAITKKVLHNSNLYFVADAVSGAPVPEAKLSCFGYKQEWVERRDDHPGGGYYRVTTKEFTGTTDARGMYIVPAEKQQDFQWMITATSNRKMAFMGYDYVWSAEYRDYPYEATRAYLITDRPVYRPEQAVQFKCWVGSAHYDGSGVNAQPSDARPTGGKAYTVRIHNPRGEKVFEKTFTADAYGGFDGSFTPGKDDVLGPYSVSVYDTMNGYGGGTFRVEEYKKPEFEVTVKAPEEPVMLGETITATVKADYYFGAPVTEAKVKYKVERTGFTGDWYPASRWDWFYGPGYWWYAYDYDWYPGWSHWGCRRPRFAWWQHYGYEQPEIVAQGEAAIGADGTLKISFDSALAKAMQGDRDHRYRITAEVTDQSRRTIVGTGEVLAARQPFRVYAWTGSGYYRAGQVIHASFSARTLDSQPVQGQGVLRLLKISYTTKDGVPTPVEHEVERWALDTNDQGTAYLQLKAAQAGQYRLSYKVTDRNTHTIEGGYLFTVRGEGYTGTGYRFNDLELIPDQRDYRPGESVKLLINTNKANATVLLFLRPSNGVYQAPKVLRLTGKSVMEEIPVGVKDMPNFFVEAVTIADGQVFTETREIVVPPEKRTINVEVLPSAKTVKPGQKASVKLRLTDANGKPAPGSAVLSLYDKAVEYISGGSNVPEIKEFFWKWRRGHYPQTQHSLNKGSGNLLKDNEPGMEALGIFGYSVADDDSDATGDRVERNQSRHVVGFAGERAREKSFNSLSMMASGNGGGADFYGRAVADKLAPAAAPTAPMAGAAMRLDAPGKPEAVMPGGGGLVQPTVRSNFADTALWVAKIDADAKGEATVELTMPENLTTWKARAWAMGEGTRVGEGTAEMVTTKDVIIRLQAPRFFTQKDEVVISANVHNYLAAKKAIRTVIHLEGDTLALLDPDGSERDVLVNPKGEQRVDWRVKVLQPGTAKITVKALTDEDSDAMRMEFPVYVHGMLKTESFSGALRPAQGSGEIKFSVPAARRPEQSRLEVRYSPTLAGAMVDALPYLVNYPYGCTEQTLNRFLPTIITQAALKRMGVKLQDIEQKRTNLNAQEIGDDAVRARDWERLYQPWETPHNPVFSESEVNKMVRYGQERLASMQCSDGGWGWFSGYGEQSWPHTTALVVHGLQAARDVDALSYPDMLKRGITWLANYQKQQVEKLKEWEQTKGQHGKQYADALDAFVYMVLADEKQDHDAMRGYLYRDRTQLPVYAKAMFACGLQAVKRTEERAMVQRNIEQYLQQDEENQTAWLELPENNYWWCWYGSDIEADAYYLKLLTRVDPKGQTASRLVKYLMNNRKHATYWNSTRDTAIVVEAFADYLKTSGESLPNLTVTLALDGTTAKTVKITADNLFSFDNKLVLTGDALRDGAHTLTLTKQGTGSLYYNAYLTNFTLEDQITRAGLEVKVNRQFYLLVPKDKTVQAAGDHGQVLDKKVEKFERKPLANLDTVKSGDLIEVELTIDSKNDYEYLLFEDMKAAGCEAAEVRSGYSGQPLGAYMELRDERVCFFVRSLPRGTHSLSYRLRAEIPGRFSALPTRASALYAPELKANSDEMKLEIED